MKVCNVRYDEDAGQVVVTLPQSDDQPDVELIRIDVDRQ